MAAGAEQRAVAEGGARGKGVGASLAFVQHAALGGQQLVGPGRSELGRGAQFAPVVAQVLDVRRVVFLYGHDEAIEPLLARGGFHWRVRDHRHEFLNSAEGGIAERAGGAVDLVQGWRQPFQEQDGTIGCCGRVLPGDGADLG
jgi:hypothetical protein